MTIFSAIAALAPILGQTSGPIWVVGFLAAIVGAIFLAAYGLRREDD